MTEPSDPRAEAATDSGPEVTPEVIQDLDVTEDDADDIVGGRCTVKDGKVIPGVTVAAD